MQNTMEVGIKLLASEFITFDQFDFIPGGNPYPGVEINEKFIGLLKSGYRMEKPDYASDEL